MSDPLFLLDELADPLPALGATVELGGPEGRHASVVRRIRPGESMLIGDGRGRGVRDEVLAASKAGLVVTVIEQLISRMPAVRYVAVQALAKAARDELAVEMLTELGVQEIVPWQAQRSVVRWSGDRSRSALARWRSTVREAAKQSRRLHVPVVSDGVLRTSTAGVVALAGLLFR